MKMFDKSFFAGTGTGGGIARGLLAGLVIGLGVTIAFFALAFAAELLNYATGGFFQKIPPASGVNKSFLPSGFAGVVGMFSIWKWRDFHAVASFFIIAAIPIGAVYGYALQKQLRDEEKRARGKEAREAGASFPGR